MRRLILLLIIFISLINQSFASFPIDKNVITSNNDPTTDSWMPIIIVFWLLILIIPIFLIRFAKRTLKRKKDK